jgi:hypothetical protein
MRSIDVASAAAMAAPNVHMALLAELHFASDIVYCWTGTCTLVYGGHNWIGLGKLANVSTIQEGSAVQADGIAISLEGIDPNMISDALGEVQQGLPCILSMAFFDDSPLHYMLGSPVVCFAGRMDEPTINEGTDTCTISIACENRMALLNQSHERRYTDQDQRRDYPNDCGFSYVNTVQNWVSTWGQ